MLKINFRAMGSNMAAFLDTDTDQASQALSHVVDWFEQWEQVLSRFRPDSELNALNDNGGRPFQASPVLWEVVNSSLRAAQWSDGLVVPTVLDALLRSGYDRSFELIDLADHTTAFNPCIAPGIASPVQPGNWRDIRMDRPNHTITLPVDARIDLGGVAKGWAAAQAARRLQKFGPALVDASGDIAASGCRTGGHAWVVDVADPLHFQEALCQVNIGRCGIATSGIDYRRWLRDGAWKHHIIDPRTSEPASTDLVSATIVAANTVKAEVAAKVVMILGSFSGMMWLENHKNLAGLFVGEDGRLLISQSFQQYVRRKNDR